MLARSIAVLVLAGALLCVGAEALQWLASGNYDTFTGTELWRALDGASLAFVEAGVHRMLAPWVWDPVLAGLLAQPAWLLLGLPALMVLWLKPPRQQARFLRRRIFAAPRRPRG